MDCRVLSAGMLHLERETSLDDVLATLELLAQRFREELERGRSARVTELVVDGVRVAIMPTAPDSRRTHARLAPVVGFVSPGGIEKRRVWCPRNSLYDTSLRRSSYTPESFPVHCLGYGVRPEWRFLSP